MLYLNTPKINCPVSDSWRLKQHGRQTSFLLHTLLPVVFAEQPPNHHIVGLFLGCWKLSVLISRVAAVFLYSLSFPAVSSRGWTFSLTLATSLPAHFFPSCNLAPLPAWPWSQVLQFDYNSGTLFLRHFLNSPPDWNGFLEFLVLFLFSLLPSLQLSLCRQCLIHFNLFCMILYYLCIIRWIHIKASS